MEAAELLKQGKLDDALARLQEQVRSDPAAAKHRVFLFQLLAVMGRWDKALTQLNVAADLDPKTLLMAQVCRQTLQCEAFRAEVFAGRRSPLVFGQPDEWVGWLIQANQLAAEGRYAQSVEMRNKALEAAPAVAGNVDGKPFEWLADADPRLGPVLEAIVDGKYFWIPMRNIQQISVEPPADLRDIVWLPANFTWANGGVGVGMIPSRYPGTEAVDDGPLRLARRTDWRTLGPDLDVPLGQRLFATNDGDYPLLALKRITFDVPAAPMNFDVPAVPDK
ncbi:MAG: type VI secretion system accessory protein TagJ [Tepidisphaerales bacterium]